MRIIDINTLTDVTTALAHLHTIDHLVHAIDAIGHNELISPPTEDLHQAIALLHKWLHDRLWPLVEPPMGQTYALVDTTDLVQPPALQAPQEEERTPPCHP